MRILSKKRRYETEKRGNIRDSQNTGRRKSTRMYLTKTRLYEKILERKSILSYCVWKLKKGAKKI